MRRKTIAYFAIKFPNGESEAFIFPEVEAHMRAGFHIVFCPLLSGDTYHNALVINREDVRLQPLISRKVLAGFLQNVIRRPSFHLKLLTRALSGSPKVMLRNIAVMPKAIWLGDQLREKRVDHIHAHWLSTSATAAMMASAASGIPFSVTAHRIDISQNNLIPEKAQSSVFIRAIDSKGQSEIQAVAGDRAHKVKLVYLGTDVPDRAAPLREGKLSRAKLVTAARLVEKKGHEYLVDAVRQLAQEGVEVDVDLFGDGPLLEPLKARAAACHVDRIVHFKGNLPHEELVATLRSGEYDIAVLPSVVAKSGDREGIPAFLMEAMAAGVPVISTANGGIAELIRPGCGLIVPERDPVALAAAIRRACEEPDLRLSMAGAGRDQVVKRFSVEACAAELRRLMDLEDVDPRPIALL